MSAATRVLRAASMPGRATLWTHTLERLLAEPCVPDRAALRAARVAPYIAAAVEDDAWEAARAVPAAIAAAAMAVAA